jgi:ABC-type transport system involved in Fe-S cluster assembly fused permease/ATPase subunit
MTMPFEKVMSDFCFDKKIAEDIKKNSKRMINMGMLVAPYEKFKILCKECNQLLKNKVYLADQIIVNHLLHKYNFKEISHKYHFIPMTSKEKFEIKDGEFYLKSGEKIAIVHNVGGTKSLRMIKNFGYGNDKNQCNIAKFHALRTFIKAIDHFR